MKAKITNRVGSWEFELHEDGRAELLAFTKAEPMRGLGDLVAAATKAVGIQPCPRCKRTQEQLNKAVPFGNASTSLGLGTAGGQPDHDVEHDGKRQDRQAPLKSQDA
jgi:hypothetical protein